MGSACISGGRAKSWEGIRTGPADVPIESIGFLDNPIPFWGRIGILLQQTAVISDFIGKETQRFVMAFMAGNRMQQRQFEREDLLRETATFEVSACVHLRQRPWRSWFDRSSRCRSRPAQRYVRACNEAARYCEMATAMGASLLKRISKTALIASVTAKVAAKGHNAQPA